MARYMLDTDMCSYVMKRSNQTVIKRLRAVPVADVCISIITNRSCCTVLRCRRAESRMPLRCGRSFRTSRFSSFPTPPGPTMPTSVRT